MLFHIQFRLRYFFWLRFNRHSRLEPSWIAFQLRMLQKITMNIFLLFENVIFCNAINNAKTEIKINEQNLDGLFRERNQALKMCII